MIVNLPPLFLPGCELWWNSERSIETIFDSKSVFWLQGKVNFVIRFGLECHGELYSFVYVPQDSIIALKRPDTRSCIDLLWQDRSIFLHGCIRFAIQLFPGQIECRRSKYHRKPVTAEGQPIKPRTLIRQPVVAEPRIKDLFSSMISCPSTPFIRTSKQIHLSSL